MTEAPGTSAWNSPFSLPPSRYPPAPPFPPMPDIIYRVVLPLYGVLAFLALLYHRSRIHRQIGHDPVVIRPLRRTGALATWLELVFAIGALALAVDIAINGIAPDFVRRGLAVPLLRESALVGWAGLLLMTAGLAVCSVAIRHMGTSWRMEWIAHIPARS